MDVERRATRRDTSPANRSESLNSFARAAVDDLSLGNFVERDGDWLVRVDRFAIDERLAREVFAAIGCGKLLHADPIVQLASALGYDVDEAELGVGVLQQYVKIAEYGFAHGIRCISFTMQCSS